MNFTDGGIAEIFNEYLEVISIFTKALFNRMEFTSGVSIGAIILIIAVFSIVVGMLYGRIKNE